jgi:hypothetical protein
VSLCSGLECASLQRNDYVSYTIRLVTVQSTGEQRERMIAEIILATVLGWLIISNVRRLLRLPPGEKNKICVFNCNLSQFKLNFYCAVFGWTAVLNSVLAQGFIILLLHLRSIYSFLTWSELWP